MRILIDFTQIPVERTGVGVYAENLVSELLHEIDGADTLIILLQRDEQRIPRIVSGSTNVTVSLLPSRMLRNRLLLLAYEQMVLPFLLRRLGVDLVHSLHYTHPLFSPCPRVVTIHDLTFVLYPRLHTRGRRLVMPFFIRHAFRRAEGLIFVSESTRADAEKRFGRLSPLCRVVPLAVDAAYLGLRPGACDATLKQLGIPKPYLLFLGTIEPRKNLPRLVAAFDRIAAELPSLHLVVGGKQGWGSAETLQALRSSRFHARIHRLGYIGESEKQCLLANCGMLVYPSLYEGFGLPVLEAMAAGVPVVTSNLSSLPEVAGDTARLVDPRSVDELADAILDLMRNESERTRLGSAARERAKLFSWRRVAAETLRMYRDVLDQSSRPRDPEPPVQKARRSEGPSKTTPATYNRCLRQTPR